MLICDNGDAFLAPLTRTFSVSISTSFSLTKVPGKKLSTTHCREMNLNCHFSTSKHMQVLKFLKTQLSELININSKLTSIPKPTFCRVYFFLENDRKTFERLAKKLLSDDVGYLSSVKMALLVLLALRTIFSQTETDVGTCMELYISCNFYLVSDKLRTKISKTLRQHS